MYAKVKLSNDIKSILEFESTYIESFEEIKKLVFTKERLEKEYSYIEVLNLSTIFQDIKMSAIHKVLKEKKLSFPEGFVIERLLAKHMDSEYISVEDHIEKIKIDCCNNRKERRENDRKFSKLYLKFMQHLLENKKERI